MDRESENTISCICINSYVLACSYNIHTYLYRSISLQIKPAGNDRAYNFCAHLVRRSDSVLRVLRIALEKTQQTHINDELKRIEEDW